MTKSKRYLMSAMAVLTMGTAFVACGEKDLYDPEIAAKKVVNNYEQKFVEAFGTPASNQDWGFGVASRATRSITINNDVYDMFTFPTSEELTAAFPTAVPGDADELPTAGDYSYFYGNGADHNYVITAAGEYSVGGSWMNTGWISDSDHPYGGYTGVFYYNVYVNVNGDVTLKRNGDAHFNLYILQGNVTLDSNFGEMSGTISVADGATLNDNRDHIACNYGVKLYNRGTVNVGAYKIGNNAKIYNESTFTATGALEYNSGAGNTAWFYNVGDGVELTAPSMTLNSTCNFFSDGIVNITGETFVTKDGIVWINNGHYTTGSITWSAKNTSFYNYCQLMVTGNAHMYDGEFNLMPNSYMEAGTAELDNFIVNMYGDAGINIKGAVDLQAQGDGTFQGFKNANNSTNNYVLFGGKVTVASHQKTLSIESGITFSIKEIEIIKEGNVVTEAELLANNDGDYPVLDFNGTECPYGKLTVTPNDNSCGAIWIVNSNPSIRVMAEDLSVTEKSDFDFNDIVIDFIYDSDTRVKCILQAAGGTLPLRINEDDTKEVHLLFGVDTDVMVNTNAQRLLATHTNIKYADKSPVEFFIDGTFSQDEADFKQAVKNIKIEVQKNTETGLQWIEMAANQGKVAGKIGCPVGTDWCDEKEPIETKYPKFKQYVKDPTILWWVK